MVRFGIDPEESFEHLYDKIRDIYYLPSLRGSTLREIQQLFNKHKYSLSNPLQYKRRDPNDRSQIPNVNQVGVPRSVDINLVEIVTKLSDEFDLNELEATNFVVAALQRSVATRSESIYKDAINLFFNERQYLLCSLLTILQGKSDELSHQVQDLFLKFTHELSRQNDENRGLINNLCQSIIEYNSNIVNKTLTLHYRDEYKSERKSLTECLFHACNEVVLSKEEIFAIFDAFQNTVITLSQQKRQKEQQRNMSITNATSQATLQVEEEETFRVSYMFCLILCNAIDPLMERFDLANRQKIAGNKLFEREDFVDNFYKRLTVEGNNWLSTEDGKNFQGVMLLQWALLLHCYHEVDSRQVSPSSFNNQIRDHDAFKFAIETRSVLSFISNHLLRSTVFQRDSTYNKQYLVESLMSMIINMLVHLKHLVDDQLYLQDEEFRIYIRAIDNEQRDLPPLRQFFQDLCDVIVALTLKTHCVNVPKFARQFWPDSSTNARLVTFIMDQCLRFAIGIFHSFNSLFYTPVFVALMNLLRALSPSNDCANQAFDLLRQQEFPSLQWDILFQNMQSYPYIQDQSEQEQRQQQQQYDFTTPSQYVNVQPTMTCQNDLLILSSIMRLVEQVVKVSPQVKKLMLENSRWEVLQTLFGMFTIRRGSIDLLGQTFRTLAAFARGSQQVSNEIWNRLEMMHILDTDRTSHLDADVIPEYYTNVKFQLEQVESYEQIYPVTLGFLHLIRALLSQGIPPNLGSEYREPGFGPYLHFIQENVFIKFATRGYSVQGQEWAIALKCLRILNQLLTCYVPSVQDFYNVNLQETVQQGELYLPNKAPGFEIMRDMLSSQQTKLLRVVLQILRGNPYSIATGLFMDGTKPRIPGVELLEYEKSNRKYGTHYEKSVLLSMDLIEQVLIKQDAFRQCQSMNPLQHNKTSELLPITTLDQPLIESGYVIDIAEYMRYTQSASIRYSAVRILSLITQTNSQRKLVQVFRVENKHHHLMRLFVEMLRDGITSDVEPELTPEQELEQDMNNETREETTIINDTRTAILQLLIYNVDAPVESLTHFLCGLKARHDGISEQEMMTDDQTDQDDVHCLAVILELLTYPTLSVTHPHFTEQCFNLIYRLCRDYRVSRQTLNYLEKHDFFNKFILVNNEYLPSILQYHFNQRAHVMRTIALKIFSNTFAAKSSASLKYRGSVQELVNMLCSNEPILQDDNALIQTRTSSLEQRRTQMLELLDSIETAAIEIKEPKRISVPDLPITEKDIQSVLSKDQSGLLQYNIQSLQRILQHAEQVSLEQQSTALLDDRKQVIKECLISALTWNRYYQQYAAIRNCFEAWKQVIEIVISQCYDMLGASASSTSMQSLQDEELQFAERIVYDLLQQLLTKFSSSRLTIVGDYEFRVRIETALSQIIFRLMGKLRERRLSSFTQLNRLPLDQCLNLLTAIIRCILRDDHAITAETRGNLNATLFQYIQYTRKSVTSRVVLNPMDNTDPVNLLTALTSQQQDDEIERNNERILLTFDNNLIARLAQDALDSSNIWKAVALSTLDALMKYDVNVDRWTLYLEKTGLLQRFVSFVEAQEKTLLSLLRSIPTSRRVNMNELYLYENVMSLLLSIAQVESGAQLLSNYDIIAILVKCKFLDWSCIVGDSLEANDEPIQDDLYDPFTADSALLDKYHQVLLPALRLIASLFVSLRNNRRVAEQVVTFVKKRHLELVRVMKQVVDDYVNHEQRQASTRLEQVKLITSLFYLLSHHIDMVRERLQTTLKSFELHMLHLMEKRSSHDDDDDNNNAGNSLMEENDNYVRQIVKNVVGYCRVVTDNALTHYMVTPVILFQALDMDGGIDSRVSMRIPSMNMLYSILERNLSHLESTLKKRNTTATDLLHIDEMAPQRIQEILNRQIDERAAKDLYNAQDQPIRNTTTLTYRYQSVLLDRLTLLDEKLSSYLYIVEGLILVLWRHLNLYLQDTAMQFKSSTQDKLSTKLPQLMTAIQREQIQRKSREKLSIILELIAKVNRELKSEFLRYMSRRFREEYCPPTQVLELGAVQQQQVTTNRGRVTWSPFVTRLGSYDQNQ